jgi:hypothetical protein
VGKMVQMADLEDQRDLKTRKISETYEVTARERQVFEDLMSSLYELYELDYGQVIGNIESVDDDKVSRERRSVQNSFNAVFVITG